MIIWNKLKRVLADPFSFRSFSSDIKSRLDALKTEIEQVKEYSASCPLSIESFAVDIRDRQRELQTELGKVKELSSSFPDLLESFAANSKEQQNKLQMILEDVRKHVPENPLSLEAFAADMNKHQERLQNDVEFIKNHLSSYLGNGTGLTHLIDETPIYINTNDFGCPSNFINGGRYEEEYFTVLASFRKPASVFLDIGSNLGVFSLRMAPLLRHGKIYAFEPNSAIRELFARSIHLNGIKHLINLYEFGVSDVDRRLYLSVPEGHAGGGSLTASGGEGAGVAIEVRRLDGLLPDVDFDIAKIDVEGHELQALRGMTGMLRRSANAVVLFEKLNAHSGIEAGLMNLFAEIGMSIYRIDGVTLTAVDLSQFSASEAYFLAARPSTIGQELTRNFITLYPDDLYAIASTVRDDCLVIDAASAPGSLLFHGPYWYLPRGTYNIAVNGEIEGEFSLALAEKFGYQVEEFVVSAQARSFNIVVQRDLTHFEIAGRALTGRLAIKLNNIRFTRLG